MSTPLNIDTLRRFVTLAIAASEDIAEWCSTNYTGAPLLVTEGSDAASDAELNQCPGIAVNNGSGDEECENAESGRSWSIGVECRLRDERSARLAGTETPAPATGVQTLLYAWPQRLAELSALVNAAVVEAFNATNCPVASVNSQFDHRSAWPVVFVTVSFKFKAPALVGAVINLVD